MADGVASRGVIEPVHKNASLNAAAAAKNDEFYTQLSDIEKELAHYTDHFRGKVVYCNCDDPTISNFFRYFSMKFADLGLKKLITTCYRNQHRDFFSRHDVEHAIKLEYDGFRDGERVPNVEDIGVTPLDSDGDFRSPECIEILKEADVVVTNPPFSLFREFVAQLIEHDKRFLIVGNQNAATYKEIFPLVRDNRIWLGVTPKGQDMLFDVPEEYAQQLKAHAKEGSAYKVVNGIIKGRLGNAAWFTNLDHRRRHEPLVLYRRYTREDYPTYDSYNAIEVGQIRDIPEDYAGAMGVPITFLDKYNPDQFEILDANTIRTNDRVPIKPHGLIKDKDSAIGGKPKYARVVIRNRMLQS